MNKVYILSPSDVNLNNLENYASKLEETGLTVFLPHRHNNTNLTVLEIKQQNFIEIKNADEVHVFYQHLSQSIYFDLGITFALNKKIVVVENKSYTNDMFYSKMFDLMNNLSLTKIESLKFKLKNLKEKNISDWENNETDLSPSELLKNEIELESNIIKLENMLS